MNKDIKTSIIIPVYNVEKYLPKCLDSCINQTLQDIEIICVNDESPDNCAQILEDYAQKDNRIVVLNQKNSGQGSARNRGLEIAKGKYIQFLDSDDSYDPYCCEELYRLMEENPDIDVACFDTNIVFETNEDKKDIYEKAFATHYTGSQKIRPAMVKNLNCNCWNKVFRKSFIDEKNLRFPEKMHFEDVALFWYWLTQADKVYFYRKKLINYLVRPGSFLDEISTKSSAYIFDAFRAYEQIYNHLNKIGKLNDYQNLFLQKYIDHFQWLKNCFAENATPEKKKLIDTCSKFLGSHHFDTADLSPDEQKCFDNILQKNYYYFNAYETYDITTATPAFSKDNITVVFSTDRNYVSYLSVTLASIIENSSSKNNYDIIILTNDLLSFQKQFLLSLCMGRSNVSIRFFDMDGYIKNFGLDQLFTVNHITISAYFRLFVGKIFAAYKKILYLDCDLVVNTDIAELYHMDIGDYPIAAALDTTISNSLTTTGMNTAVWGRFRTYMKNTLGFTSQSKYFNSGVMVIDIEKFNETDLDHLIDLAERNNKFFHDQNVLNAAFEGNYFILPPTWNFQWNIKFHSTDYQSVLSPDVLALYEDPNIQAAIVHYTSHEKPWKNPCHSFADIWWKYAQKSPFYPIILKNFLGTPAKPSDPTSQETPQQGIPAPILRYRKNRIKYFIYSALLRIPFFKKSRYLKDHKMKYKTRTKEYRRIMKQSQ